MPEIVNIADLGEQCFYNVTESPLPDRGDYCRLQATSEVFDGRHWLFRCDLHRAQVSPGKTGKWRINYEK